MRCERPADPADGCQSCKLQFAFCIFLLFCIFLFLQLGIEVEDISSQLMERQPEAKEVLLSKDDREFADEMETENVRTEH